MEVYVQSAHFVAGSFRIVVVTDKMFPVKAGSIASFSSMRSLKIGQNYDKPLIGKLQRLVGLTSDHTACAQAGLDQSSIVLLHKLTLMLSCNDQGVSYHEIVIQDFIVLYFRLSKKDSL